MRPSLRISLLGRFAVHCAGQDQLDHIPHKAQELLAYLVLHEGKAQPRETLAEVLWGQCDTPNSRKYLRQSLWQLHAGLVSVGRARAARMLHGKVDWIELTLDDGVVTDVAQLEHAFVSMKSLRGEDLSREQVQTLTGLVRLYRGDLLQGWSAEWCFYDRERYRRMCLSILDKLADYFEARHEYDAVAAYATLSLVQDPARERGHRSLMRALAKSGERSAALRQYERCVECVRDELGVDPEPETVVLESLIREGQIVGAIRQKASPNGNGLAASGSLTVLPHKGRAAGAARRT